MTSSKTFFPSVVLVTTALSQVASAAPTKTWQRLSSKAEVVAYVDIDGIRHHDLVTPFLKRAQRKSSAKQHKMPKACRGIDKAISEVSIAAWEQGSDDLFELVGASHWPRKRFERCLRAVATIKRKSHATTVSIDGETIHLAWPGAGWFVVTNRALTAADVSAWGTRAVPAFSRNFPAWNTVDKGSELWFVAKKQNTDAYGNFHLASILDMNLAVKLATAAEAQKAKAAIDAGLLMAPTAVAGKPLAKLVPLLTKNLVVTQNGAHVSLKLKLNKRDTQTVVDWVQKVARR